MFRAKIFKAKRGVTQHLLDREWMVGSLTDDVNSMFLGKRGGE